jgi:hypothetical protein
MFACYILHPLMDLYQEALVTGTYKGMILHIIKVIIGRYIYIQYFCQNVEIKFTKAMLELVDGVCGRTRATEIVLDT